MRIIWYEMKKLLNWKVLSLVFLISVLFFEVFLSFEFEYFPNGRPPLDTFNVSKQMIDKYGQEMDETEFVDFKETYKEEVDRAESYLKSRDDAEETGVTSYEQFRSTDGELHGEVMFNEGVDVFWELQARENLIEFYERRIESFLNETTHIDNAEWKQEIVNGSSLNAILPHFVFENYNNLIKMLTILIMIIVMIVVGRVFIVDQKNDMIILQYTTLTGRTLYIHKIIAALITAFLLTSVYIAGFLLLYSTNETDAFFQSSLHSFDTHIIFWTDITFIDYIIFTIMGVYIVVLVAAALAMFLSRVVGNYISLIGSQVPIVVVLSLLILEYLVSNFMSIKYPLYVTIGTYCGLLVLGVILLTIRWRKEQRIDIV